MSSAMQMDKSLCSSSSGHGNARASAGASRTTVGRLFFFFPHVQDLQPEAPVHELTCDL